MCREHRAKSNIIFFSSFLRSYYVRIDSTDKCEQKRQTGIIFSLFAVSQQTGAAAAAVYPISYVPQMKMCIAQSTRSSSPALPSILEKIYLFIDKFFATHKTTFHPQNANSFRLSFNINLIFSALMFYVCVSECVFSIRQRL